MNVENKSPLIVHIIYALKAGGLENGLVNIINRTPVDRYRHAIICLTEADEFANRITRSDVIIIQLHKKLGHDIGLYWRLWRSLRTLQPAVVHTRNLASLEMQLVSSLLPGVKRVHGEHGRDIDDLEGKSRKYNLLRKILRPFIHRYISVSRDLHNWLKTTLQVNPDKLTQIYNGVDTEKFHPAEKRNTALLPEGFHRQDLLLIGTVGRLAEVKNQQLLIKAIHGLTTKVPDLADRLGVIIVGGGPMHKFLKQQVETLGLTNVIWFAGDRKDVPELLQLMDIFVLPSLAEGISNTILEAMATGLPVIATDVGGNPELIKDGLNGRLVPNNDPESLASALAELLADNQLRESLALNALSKVKSTFTWERTVNEYLAVYDELLPAKERIRRTT